MSQNCKCVVGDIMLLQSWKWYWTLVGGRPSSTEELGARNRVPVLPGPILLSCKAPGLCLTCLLWPLIIQIMEGYEDNASGFEFQVWPSSSWIWFSQHGSRGDSSQGCEEDRMRIRKPRVWQVNSKSALGVCCPLNVHRCYFCLMQ